MASRIHGRRVQDMPKRKTDKLARAKARPDPRPMGRGRSDDPRRGCCRVFPAPSIDIIIVDNTIDTAIDTTFGTTFDVTIDMIIDDIDITVDIITIIVKII